MKRRKFLGRTLTGGAIVSGAGLASSCTNTQQSSHDIKQPRQTVRVRESGKYDILLKNGYVIDPANNINGMMDVAVADGKIALAAQNIPAGDSKRTVDVSGLYVTPGILDIHAHVYHGFPIGVRSVIPDDICFNAGTTTVVDAGTSGVESFEGMKNIIDNSRMRILAFINIAAPGMTDAEQDPRQFKVPPMVELAKKHPDVIVGFKTAHYWWQGPYDELHTPWASVDALLDAGRRANLPVMIHSEPRTPSEGHPARSFRELVLEKMRPGDIHTHIFGRAYPSTQNGKVNPDMIKAQEKGVIFDVGHGSGSFVFRHAHTAVRQGFMPNSISTDLYGRNSNGPVINMTNLMTKFLNMGMSLEDVIRCSTINPAREINHPELGNLSAGSPADIAVIDMLTGDFGTTDTGGFREGINGKVKGDKRLQNVMTLFGGQTVFDLYALDAIEWEDIPRDNTYWTSFSGQDW